MAKFADIDQKLQDAVASALAEFLTAAREAESRQKDPVSIINVRIVLSGTNQVEIGPGTRSLLVEKKVPD